MADAILSAFLKMLFNKLASAALQELALLFSVRSELDSLQSSLTTIQLVLDDAEDRQVKEKPLREWLRELKHAAYDADDVLDEFAAEALRRSVDTRIMKKVRGVFSPSNNNTVVFRYKITHKMKDILEKLNAIAEKRFKFHLREGFVDRRVEIEMQQQETHGFVIESDIFGRKEEKEMMIELLLTGAGGLSVIPIVGMGGLGKTTLAQLAYNDADVEGYFNLRMWVCVSKDFDLRRLVIEIIESADRKKCDPLHLDILQSRLRELLNGKRFLLVLDNVWNEELGKWDELKTLLRGGVSGSKIIVTTRAEQVASIMGTVAAYKLGGLSEGDCWSLFKQWAFGADREEKPELVAIGRDIVKKCRGVPLAAKVLGSLMRFKSEERDWLFVKESEIWNLPEENGVLAALRLSYDHLPSYLKQCFAYCSIFPRDFTIEKEKLIQLWIAEGFIQSVEGRKQMEDTGREYFKILLWRSFFQEVQLDDEGNITSCKMHDLIHDLARFVANDECSIMEPCKEGCISKMTRHASLVSHVNVSSTVFEAFYTAKSLRTFLLPFMCKNFKEVPETMFSRLKYLRVLDLSGTGIKNLPISIGNLKHLRYLDLSRTYIEKLPESVSGLQNLQMLKLLECKHFRQLPKDMRKMISLRHIKIDINVSLTHMPRWIGQLSCLQTLPLFIVGKKHGFTLVELNGLNLRGELNIKNLENVRNFTDANYAKLNEKENLHSLGLLWKPDSYVGTIADVEQALDGLQPHQNLRRLAIENYGGTRFPSWIRKSFLPNIVEVSLTNCKLCEHLPPFGELPSLKILTVEKLYEVRCVVSRPYDDNVARGFPSLKQLTFSEMSNLEEWSRLDGREILPCIAKLTIKRCPELTTFPRLQSLEDLELWNSNDSLVRALANLTSLSSLDIHEFQGLMYLPEGFLRNNTNLQTLKIRYCPMLKSLSTELDNLTALTRLTIEKCDKLTHFPEGLKYLTSLESWQINGCHSLRSLPGEGLRGLKSLIDLSIYYCRDLRSLSKGIQYLTSLQKLSISTCGELAFLPEEMQHLASLQTLEISSCPKFISLPQGLQHVITLQNLKIHQGLTELPNWLGELKSLRELEIWNCAELRYMPEGVRSLTALQHLSIIGCPYLAKRCKRETGEDWHKIKHIPEINIHQGLAPLPFPSIVRTINRQFPARVRTMHLLARDIRFILVTKPM